MQQTYLYELMEGTSNPSTTDIENTFGLFHADGTPKPAATAIHNLTGILSDSSQDATSFQTGSLNYSITDLPSTGNSMLMEKADGTFDLMVWNEAQDWDPNTQSEINVPASNVTVDLGGTYQTVKIFDPLQGDTAIQTLNNVSSVNLGLTDHPLIVEVEPQSGGTSPSTSDPGGSSSTTPNSGGSSSTTPTPGGSSSTTPTPQGGPDRLVLGMSEDAYQGDAQFTVSVDGKQIGGVRTVTASHADGHRQRFVIKGNFGAGPHNVTVNFVNDAWDPQGPEAGDRNLYIEAVKFNGSLVTDTPTELYANYGVDVSIPASDQSNSGSTTPSTGGSSSPTPTTGGSSSTNPTTPTPQSGLDKLVLEMSEDAYHGDAQFTVSVDGKQVGGTRTVTAFHAAGPAQRFVIKGNFGAGAHTVAVNFVNDAWDPQGPAAGDRNLYVNSIRFDGSVVSSTSTELYANGGVSFSIPASAHSNSGLVSSADAGAATITMSDESGQSYTIDPSQTRMVVQEDARFDLMEGNNAQVILGTGTDNIQFTGMASVVPAPGSGNAVVQADAGQNQFTAGSGNLDVTGGSGADAYTFHNGDDMLTIEDFSLGKGDTLIVGQALQGSMQVNPDGQGGTMITFGSGSAHGIDLAGVSNFDSTQIHFA